MNQHTLLVCNVCHVSPDQKTLDGQTGGAHLLNQLTAFDSDEARESKLAIQATGCLWTCDRPCSATFVCPSKYTYHFVDLSPFDSHAALLKFGELYTQSDNGYVLPAKLPKLLQPKLLVRIPDVPPVGSIESPSRHSPSS